MMRPASEEEAAAATAELCAWPPLVTNWLDLRHQLSALHDVWTWAISTDAAERAARAGLDGIEGGPAGADWPEVAEALRALAAQVAKALDRTPVQWRGPAGQVPAEVMAAQTYDNGGALWFTARAAQRIEAGQLVAVEPGEEGEYTFLRGWTLADLVADGGGMLAIEAALVAASGGLHGAKMAQTRWADFEAGGPIQPVPGAPGAAAFGLSDDDAKRLRALWRPYLADRGAPNVKGLPMLAWKVVKARRAHAADRGRRGFVTHNGDAYAGASKVAPAAAWAFGAYSDQEVVTLDDQRYMTLHRPRVAGVVQGRFPSRRVVQLGFPFDAPAAPAALVSLAANDTQFALSPLAGKMLVWMLCTVPTSGFLGESLEELARAMHRHTKFRREYIAATAAAAREIRGLLVVFDDQSDAPLFDMRLPGALGGAPDPSGIVEVEWAPAMARATNPYRHSAGEVLVNRSAIERMPLQHPLYLRAYTRAAGWWNDALGMRHGALPELSRAELAREFNALSVHAATDKGQGRKRKSDAAGAVGEALEWLEAHGLAKLETVGTGRHQRTRVAPPAAHVEAYRERAKRGARSDG